ncbi:MAG: RNA pseudouridine synthase [Bdellovibrio sp. CG12_big_fil_rev_8_21_14_0_65_39_13]|nr:MAG: RNA pseudouridine synthase [Bdellovibrio sp. CG22_combo_CG10-13_8_21_14_all_39_27]PIQ58237.1 MAG: RNA pseudouridine synthase [Bdellovibrio sp. CG12_big_fil_rev_8_21_14_0_65_39_13]PIR36646.1 MAG: RNA pseudouridine synthase [Bdellovibrio sp. CG11_big_fil_rev_8_21_14_0_20_39_38]
MQSPSMKSILFQNEHLIAIHKPSGWLSVPGREGKNEQRDCLSFWLQERLKIQIYPVHRLDREVSGVILYAKNVQAHREFNMAFENHSIRKTYQALSLNCNDLPHPPIKWENLLVRGKKRSFEAPHGKKAITEVSKVELASFQNRQCSLWKLHPVTGRSHQLRVHLSQAGYPIWGDVLYGGDPSFEDGSIALRSIRADIPVNLCLKFGVPAFIETEKFVSD